MSSVVYVPPRYNRCKQVSKFTPWNTGNTVKVGFNQSINIVAIMEDVCESWFWFRHCFLYSKAHLRYMCFLVHSSVQHILCCVFILCFVVLCTLCCQFLWTVHVRLPFWYSLTFIDKMMCGINEEWSICRHLLRFSLRCNLNKTLCMLESWCYL